MNMETIMSLVKKFRVLLFNAKTLKGVLVFILIYSAFLTDIWLGILALSTLVICIFFKTGSRGRVYILSSIFLIVGLSFSNDSFYYISKTSILKDSTELDYISTNECNLLFYFFPKFLWLEPCSATIPYEIGLISDEIKKKRFKQGRIVKSCSKSGEKMGICR